MNKKPILPPRRGMTSIAVHSLKNDRKLIYLAYRDCGTWKALGEKLGIKPLTAYRFVCYGTKPRSAAEQIALGLPVLAPAPVCARCGIVHLAKRCPAMKADLSSKPRRNWRAMALLAGVLIREWLG